METNEENKTSVSTTIFALSSGAGRAGVAVLRISGPVAGIALERMIGELPEARVASFRAIKFPESPEIIDRGLVLWFPAPKSFTGENVVELHLHGGRAIVAAVLDALGQMPGLRMAEPGEFARRAFDNGKFDLTAAEGLADLINAETEAQRRQAFLQSEGALQTVYDGWRERLIHVLAMTEAALDFSDEGDVPGEVAKRVLPEVQELTQEIKAHLNDNRRGEILRDGFRVVIAGPANAGKSSLLNVLAQRDAAIVSEEAGTTRDVVEIRLDLGGFPVIVSDTAGFRETKGAIEKEGMRRSVEQAQYADLILWLGAPDQLEEPIPSDMAVIVENAERIVRVVNKVDLIEEAQTQDYAHLGDVLISVKTGEGIDMLTARLKEEAAARIGDQEDPAISNARQRQELENCKVGLDDYLAGAGEDLELRAEDLRIATRALGRITGRVDVEDLLDRIFSSFCIGK